MLFQCRTTDDTNIVKIWLKNETQITGNRKFNITANSLSINDIQFNDSGIYSCIALKNNKHSLRINYTLEVVDVSDDDDSFAAKPTETYDSNKRIQTNKWTKIKESKDNECKN